MRIGEPYSWFVEIRVQVRNQGVRPGDLVVQAYLSGPDEGEQHRPIRVPAGFARVHAEPGARQTARIRLPHRVFARWNCATQAWSHSTGVYVVEVGFSSHDLLLRAPDPSRPIRGAGHRDRTGPPSPALWRIE